MENEIRKQLAALAVPGRNLDNAVAAVLRVMRVRKWPADRAIMFVARWVLLF